jgi:tripartite-type tricarboxylate transporter receptor subunit TctC
VIGELLKQRAGISMVHVPYRGIGPALTDLLGGTINVMISTLAAVNPQVAAGKVKVLAIAEAKRYEGAPNIPTVAETYPGFEASAWFAIYAPAGTPPDIIHRLNGLINAALHAEDVKAKFLANSLVPSGGTPEMLGQLTRSDYERWGKLIKKNNIKAD